jgi:hypothetical protein
MHDLLCAYVYNHIYFTSLPTNILFEDDKRAEKSLFVCTLTIMLEDWLYKVECLNSEQWIRTDVEGRDIFSRI